MHAYVKHRSPGRLRLRIPQARNHQDILHRLSDQARRINGLTATEINPVTGSLLLRFDEEITLDPAQLADFLSTPDLPIEIIDSVAKAVEAISPGTRSEISEALSGFLSEADRVVRTTTDNKLDLGLMLPLAAAAGALGYLGRTGSTTPLWVTLMLFAITSFPALQTLPLDSELAQTLSGPAYLH